MGKPLLFLTSPSPTSFKAFPTAALMFNRILMDIVQVYQSPSSPANQIVPYGKATFSKTVHNNKGDLNKESSVSRKKAILLKMMRKAKQVAEENWDAVYSNAPVVKETMWDDKRMVARMGKWEGHLRKLVFILSNLKGKHRILEASQKTEVFEPTMVNFLLGLATYHWEKKRQANEGQKQLNSVAECFTPAAISKFARVVR